MKALLLIILTPLTLLGSFAFGQSTTPDDYVKINTPFKQIENGMILEGSIDYGGPQTNFLVDLNSPEMKDFLRYPQTTQNKEFWKRVEDMAYYTAFTLRRDGPQTSAYRYVNLSHQRSKTPIPIGQFAACNAGGCRENALFLHLALKASGIPNQYVYAKISVATPEATYVENHAFVVLEHEGKKWVIDSYNPAFNGASFDELLSKDGVTAQNQKAPYDRIEPEVSYVSKILNIHNYPAVLIPRSQVQCRSLFM